MNAGKSTSLLQSAHNYREQGMEVLLFTAAIDDRYGQGVIRSRIGLSADAIVFDERTDFIDLLNKQLALSKDSATESVSANEAIESSSASIETENGHKNRQTLACVLVDEAQFLSASQVDQLAEVVDELGIPVLCYGIRTDFQGNLFSGSSRLLAIADKLFELKTVCGCGRKATMTVRLDADGRAIAAGEQVEIGGNERYESKCRRHHRQLMRQANEASRST